MVAGEKTFETLERVYSTYYWFDLSKDMKSFHDISNHLVQTDMAMFNYLISLLPETFDLEDIICYRKFLLDKFTGNKHMTYLENNESNLNLYKLESKLNSLDNFESGINAFFKSGNSKYNDTVLRNIYLYNNLLYSLPKNFCIEDMLSYRNFLVYNLAHRSFNKETSPFNHKNKRNLQIGLELSIN